jgi:phenylacetic acid degradation operon negative regulatory protein
VKVALPDEVLSRVRLMHVHDDNPAELAGRLWDLTAWASAGEQLLNDMSAATDIPSRFVAAAAAVRHLLTDPVLPDELLPDGWPGAALRDRYARFAAELVALRNESEMMETT